MNAILCHMHLPVFIIDDGSGISRKTEMTRAHPLPIDLLVPGRDIWVGNNPDEMDVYKRLWNPTYKFTIAKVSIGIQENAQQVIHDDVVIRAMVELEPYRRHVSFERDVYADMRRDTPASAEDLDAITEARAKFRDHMLADTINRLGWVDFRVLYEGVVNDSLRD